MIKEQLSRLMQWISGTFSFSKKQAQAFSPAGDVRTRRIATIQNILEKKGIGNIVLVDGTYKCMSKDDMKAFLEYNFAAQRKWVAETFDCDNFAVTLRGMANWVLGNYAIGEVHVTIAAGGAHALNCFIDDKGEFYYIEPQNNQVFNYNSGLQKGYKPYFVIM